MYRVTSVGAPPLLYVCNIREDRVRGGWSMIRVIPPLLHHRSPSARRQIRAETNAFVSGEPVNWIITNGGSFISAAVRRQRSGPRTAAVAVTRTPSGNSWADCCLYLYRLTDRLLITAKFRSWFLSWNLSLRILIYINHENDYHFP